MQTASTYQAFEILSSVLQTDIKTKDNAVFIEVNNSIAKGNAKCFTIFKGLEVLTLKLKAHKNIDIEHITNNHNALHFVFCVEGFAMYAKADSEKKELINRQQNVIFSSTKASNSRLFITEGCYLKATVITFDKDIFLDSDEIFYPGSAPKMLSGMLKNLDSSEVYSYFGQIDRNVAKHCKYLVENPINSLTNRLRAEAATYQIIAGQYNKHQKHQTGDREIPKFQMEYIAKILEIGEYISQNLSAKITLASLSENFGMNEKKMQSGFNEIYGESVNKYIVNLRIIKAQELLEDTDLTISEIVYKIGLSSRSYFSKIFKNKFGLIPTEYRSNYHLTTPTYELAYCSDSAKKILQTDLQSILQSAKENNIANNITGCLIYHNNKFYQLLEGPKQEIQNLIEIIKSDDRHRNVRIIYENFTSGRTFDDWNMAFIQEGSIFEAHGIEEIAKININASLLKKFNDKIAAKHLWERARNYLLESKENNDPTDMAFIA